MIDAQTLVTGLSINLALLLSLAFLYSLVRTYLPKSNPLHASLIYGALFGGIAILGMLMRITIFPGVVIDGRVIIACLAGAFAGPAAGGVAGILISGYRLIVGGVGTIAGIGAILTASLMGILIYDRLGTSDRAYRPMVLLGFGVALATQGLLWGLALPPDIVWNVFKAYALPVAVFYPLGTVAIGTLLANEYRHRQTQEALRASEERLRKIHNTAPLAFMVCDIRTQIVDWNKKAEAVFGWTKAEVTGKNIFDFFVPEKERPRVKAVFSRLREGVLESHSVNENHTKHGRPITCEWNHALLRGDDGRMVASISIGLDITDRIHSRKNLENYKHILSTTKDMMGLISRDLVYRAVSNSYATILDTAPEKIVGKHIKEVLSADMLKFAMPLIQRCLSGEEVHDQSWVTYPSGRQGFSDVSYYPHYEKGTGKITGYVVSVKDLTEHKRLEEKLLQSYKMEAMGTLAGGIAHDFNNILGAVFGYAEIALKLTSDEAVKDKILKISNAADRASELVKQILTFSRQTEQVVRPLQISPIVKETLKLMRASLPASIQIKPTFASDSYILADPTQVHQVVMNLCTNAGYAMKATGGELNVSIDNIEIDDITINAHPDFKYPGRYVRLRVSDTGEGISEVIQDRIFDPFFTTKPEGEGTGMGLSMIHGIVKGYNGDISVDSQPGAGTTLQILIPAIEKSGREVKKDDAIPLPTGTENVLFVDDDPALVEIGENLLTRLGYRVTVTKSSADALQRFGRAPYDFDLVITDLTMPDMTGDKLSRELITLREDVPIILVTGFGDMLKEEEIKQIGIKKMIMKPVIERNLAESIREVLASDAIDRLS